MRDLKTIGAEIFSDWCIFDPTDNAREARLCASRMLKGDETAVDGFLRSAIAWRGSVALRVKAELRARVAANKTSGRLRFPKTSVARGRAIF